MEEDEEQKPAPKRSRHSKAPPSAAAATADALGCAPLMSTAGAPSYMYLNTDEEEEGLSEGPVGR